MTSVLVTHLESGPTVEAAITAVARRREPAVLDSADIAPGRGRYTILTCEPIDGFAIDAIGCDDPFERLRDGLSRWSCASQSGCPFVGGWIGYLAYEAGGWIESLRSRARRDIALPLARWSLYDSAAVYDALTQRWTIAAADLRGQHPRAGVPSDRLAFWERLLNDAVPVTEPSPARTNGPMTENVSAAQYMACVRRAREYIAAGDIFQVNLARRFSIPTNEPPIDTYLRLRRVNPAAYAAYMSWDENRSAILSASPELFLTLNGREVVTRPIKGTRPRGVDPQDDALQQMALRTSEKDLAELAMIVDLERNDLGRVCEYGSVRVDPAGAIGDSVTAGSCVPPGASADFAVLETHPTVHHLVATVRGRLRRDADAVDLLRAMFPGGSITGAPKVRAMQIIDELEPTQRNVYTGSIGYIGLDGSMQLNIAIRTAIVADGWTHVHVGSGIVADSDPAAEYAETQAKGAGLARTLGVNV